jgi:hypothetical protein
VLGTENVSGIQTQALGTDPIFDAAFKLFRKIRDNGFASSRPVRHRIRRSGRRSR